MSTLRLSNISNADGSATTSSNNVINGSAKAWVKFNLTGTISASYNVSSVTDTNTAYKSINLINAMPDANYVTAICQNQNTGQSYAATMTQIASSTAGRVDIWHVNEVTDVTGWMVSIIR